MCPISNIQTKASPSWTAYPIRSYFEEGLHVTVNTDNLTVSNTNLTKEYGMLSQHFGFQPKEIRKLILNGVEAAFLSDGEKRVLRTMIEQEFHKQGIAT
jgi:adenosine deaminase